MTFRLCVDLNVWIAHFLAEAKGVRVSAARTIVQAVQEGRSGLGPVQLIVSHTMLSRLQEVLIRKGATPESSGRLIDLIASFARLGPAPEFPRMVLVGGVEPTRDARPPLHDPYDPAFLPKPTDAEDGRVLDTALAGRCPCHGEFSGFRASRRHGDPTRAPPYPSDGGARPPHRPAAGDGRMAPLGPSSGRSLKR